MYSHLWMTACVGRLHRLPLPDHNLLALASMPYTRKGGRMNLPWLQFGGSLEPLLDARAELWLGF